MSDDALGLLVWAPTSIVLGGLLPTEGNRRRLLAATMRAAATERDRQAAVIAAMVGSSSSDSESVRGNIPSSSQV